MEEKRVHVSSDWTKEERKRVANLLSDQIKLVEEAAELLPKGSPIYFLKAKMVGDLNELRTMVLERTATFLQINRHSFREYIEMRQKPRNTPGP